MIASWYDNSNTQNTRQFNPTSPIAGTDVSKEDATIATGKVKVIPKKTIKDSVKPLPPELEKDEIQVMDTAEIAPSDYGTKVISTININTGDTKLISKQNPAPFIDFENLKRVGVGYGYGSEGSTAKVVGEYTFLRVGSFHLGTQAEIQAATGKSPEAKAMVIIDYRWK